MKKFYIALNLLAKALNYRAENRRFAETDIKDITEIKIWFHPHPETASIWERSHGTSGPYDNGWQIMRGGRYKLPFQCYLDNTYPDQWLTLGEEA